MSTQQALGKVTTESLLTVATNSGVNTSMITTAVGNGGTTDVIGATLTAALSQETGLTAIAAIGQIDAAKGRAGVVDAYVQSQGNSHTLTTDQSTSEMQVLQTNAAKVTSDSNGAYGIVEGKAQLQAAAYANDITYAGTNGSASVIQTEQKTLAQRPIQ
ncbi:MAG: hypothetical protein CGW95_11615 [Phenylobacterium zucineum]|nr:MAG: hypothetical protein CGW95_11615 [Phenylobacterium zucineum]